MLYIYSICIVDNANIIITAVVVVRWVTRLGTIADPLQSSGWVKGREAESNLIECLEGIDNLQGKAHGTVPNGKRRVKSRKKLKKP